MHPSTILLLLSLTALTHATFLPETLPGTFNLVFGLTTCPDVITFTQPGLEHPASTLLFDTRPTTGGTLTLVPDPTAGGSGFIRHFSVHQNVVGTFYGGVLSSRIEWETSALGADTSFVFFTPDVTFRTTWEDVIGPNQPLETASGVPVYWFETGVDYIVINNRCLLSRGDTSPTTPNSGVVQNFDDDGSCFPANAMVNTTRGMTRIDTLSTGDSVWTGHQFSQIFAWTHRDPYAGGYDYMTIILSNGKVLTLTPGHYVYVGDVAIPASQVRIGDAMSTDSGDATVVNILSNVFAQGLYNPQTKQGDIVVNSVRVTTYTTAVPPYTAHALLAPVRMAFNLWRFFVPRTNMIL